MTRATPHTVPASAAGMVFQFDRALYHLSGARGGSVGIETQDDVARTEKEYQLWEQDKLSFQNSGHPLTDRSKNLWNTLNIWAEKLSAPSIVADQVDLALVTNRPVPDCLIRMIGSATDLKEASVCVTAMRKISSEDAEVQKLISSVLERSDVFLAAMILRITLFDGGCATDPITITDEIKKNLQCPSWASPDTVGQSLAGWVQNVAMKYWAGHQPAWISHEAFNKRKHELFVELRQQRYRERPENEVLLTAEQRAAAKVRRFVEHLSSVDAEPEQLSQAVDDFLRFNTEQSRLLLEGEVTHKHWEGFFNALTRRWKVILRKHVRNSGTRSVEAVGHDVLDETCDSEYLAPLAGTPTHQAYLTCGGYHALADDDEVWWHPAMGQRPVEDQR